MSGTPINRPPTKGYFRRSVFVLVGGTAFGHIITALALPIATRLYSPADFSVLAVFASVVSIISVAACLRFDVAVSVAGTDEEAANLLVLSLAFTLLISLIFAVMVAIIPQSVLLQLSLVAISPYLWLLPLGILQAGAYSAFQGWFIRKSNFSLISRSRVGQSTAMAGGQIGFGVAGAAPVGLLLGYMLNSAVGCIVFGRKVFVQEASLLGSINRRSLRSTFHTFSQYPKYSAFEALCNSAAIQLPVIMIAAFAIGPEAGYLTLAMSVMQAPMSLIGGAIGQVYLSRAPEEYRNGNLSQFTLDTLGGLVKVGVGPLIFLAIVAPDGFMFIFGENWRRAGEIVSWMTPWFIAQFLSSPLSMAVHVTGSQRLGMCLQVYGLILRTMAVWCAASWAGNKIVEAYALSGLVFYFTFLLVLIVIVKIPLNMIFKNLIRHSPYLLLWTGLGIIVHFIIGGGLSKAFS